MEIVQSARVPVNIAAMLLGLSAVSVQGALIFKALPIGGAWKKRGEYLLYISYIPATIITLHRNIQRRNNAILFR